MKIGQAVWVIGTGGISSQEGYFLGSKKIKGVTGYRVRLADGREDLVHPSLVVKSSSSRKKNPPIWDDAGEKITGYTVGLGWVNNISSMGYISKANILSELSGLEIFWNKKKTQKKKSGYLAVFKEPNKKTETYHFLGRRFSVALENLTDAIKKATGQEIVSKEVIEKVKKEEKKPVKKVTETKPKGKRGRPGKELDLGKVMELIKQGYKQGEVADQLGLSSANLSAKFKNMGTSFKQLKAEVGVVSTQAAEDKLEKERLKLEQEKLKRAQAEEKAKAAKAKAEKEAAEKKAAQEKAAQEKAEKEAAEKEAAEKEAAEEEEASNEELQALAGFLAEGMMKKMG